MSPHCFLQAFQRSEESWAVCLAVLTDVVRGASPDPVGPVQLFAAQTLVFKCRKAWASGGCAPEALRSVAEVAGALPMGHEKLVTQVSV
jgi:hypothetical protein